ncbi:MAG: TRAP transporter small permease [Candidatus Thermoplasmatota archaeon]|nr:TRAP transporter small permease [Candidatus Thermoplasmatota archaeon]
MLSLSKIFDKINNLIVKIEEFILFLAISLLAMILIINIIARALGNSIHFTDELSNFLIIWITFIGLSFATRKGRHIRMAAIFDMSPLIVKKILIFIVSIINMVVMFFSVYISFNYISSVYFYQKLTPTLRYSYWIILLIVPVGFLLAGFHYLRTVTKNIQTKDIWISPEQTDEYE